MTEEYRRSHDQEAVAEVLRRERHLNDSNSQFLQAVYSGSTVTIPDEGNVALPLSSLDSGEDLLDRTVEDAPVILSSGYYSITATIYSTTPFTEGGSAQATISGPITNATSSGPSGAFGAVILVNMLCYYNEGDLLTISVLNFDGASSRDFGLSGVIIVKIS